VRIEAEQERLRKEAERQRIEMEQKAMMEWERYQPPPPPEVTITALTDDEPPRAMLSDDRQLPIATGKHEELKGLLEGIAGDATKIVVASELEDPDEVSATFGQYVDDFRLADAPAPPPDADPDAAAADDGAAGDE